MYRNRKTYLIFNTMLFIEIITQKILMINWSRRFKIIRKTSFDLVFKIVYERRKQTKVNL